MHSFSGATSREVLQKVKEALGDDALILSNREVAGVIEVVAVAASELTLAPSAAPIEPARHERSWHPESRLSETTAILGAAPISRRAATSARGEVEGSLEGILSEIQGLKSMLQHDIAAFAMAEAQPAAATSPILRELLSAGFTPELSRRVAASDDGAPASRALAAERLRSLLKLAPVDELIHAGGVYALVGPTGVGKTTTVAKLAARCVVRFGASKIALLTTDSYRIGAYDQLRIYARILGVAVHAVRDANDLAAALSALSDRHLVLIDTIGMSQRDRMVAEQAATLAGSDKVKRLLLVQATTNTPTLDQVIAAYRQSHIDGCILTKADEAASLAPALDSIIRHELPLHYVTDGQRVPEDLQLPDAAALVGGALEPALNDGSGLTSDEVPLLAQARGQPLAKALGLEAPEASPQVMRPLGRHGQARVVHG
jgi:flagellar biosynthesis protein FlhF